MNILYIVSTKFPYGTASSSRARHIAMLMYTLGHRVHIIADTTDESEYTAGEINEGKYFSYQIARMKVKGHAGMIMASKASMNLAYQYLQNNRVDIILSSFCRDNFKKILKCSHKHKIPYYVELCEWYDYSNYKLGKIDPRYIRISNLLKYGYKKADGIIGISTFFGEYYREIGCRIIRIPTILDVQNVKCHLHYEDDIINIIYAGNPGVSKEYLLPILEALDRIETCNIRFHIYGPSYDKILLNIGDHSDLLERLIARKKVFVYGKVPQSKMETVLSNADYSIFIRPIRRSSQAGFPTKLAESMAVGTPVIANQTGDITLYLKSGENGFLLSNQTADAVIEVMQNIKKLSQEQKNKMRVNARKTAEEHFDYHNYMDVMATFLNGE